MEIRSIMRKIVDYLNQKYVDQFTDRLDTCEQCSQKCKKNASERISLTAGRRVIQVSRAYIEEFILSKATYCGECLKKEACFILKQQNILEQHAKKILREVINSTEKPFVFPLVA